MSEQPFDGDRSRTTKLVFPALVALSMNALGCGPSGLTSASASVPPNDGPTNDGATPSPVDDDKQLRIADWAQLPHEDHPIVGTFRYQDEHCTEAVSYGSDGTRTSISGEERLEGRFRVAPKALPNGVFRMVSRVTETNGARDCWGNVTPAGHQVVRYVGFRDSFRSLWICWDEAGTDCFGPMWRVEARVTHE